MTDLICTRVRQSLFIDRDIVFDIDSDDKFGGQFNRLERSVKLRAEFKDLGMNFNRHRVELRFDMERTPAANRSSSYRDLCEQIKDFCDTRCSGFWSWKHKRRSSECGNWHHLDLDLFFEHEEDMKTWIKDHGIIIRLTH